MKRYLTLLLLLLLSAVSVAFYQPKATAAPPQQSATATPLAEEEPTVTTDGADADSADDPQVHDASAEMTTPTLEELAARVAALEARLAAQSTGDANTVTTAIYLLDSVGLHDLDVRLNEEGVIEAGDAGTVARINRVLGTVLWPTELAPEATALMAVLTELDAALSDDDLATAG
ncbi:MAG: hypothetical protein R2867_09455 [Caldilineaceae bacterium]